MYSSRAIEYRVRLAGCFTAEGGCSLSKLPSADLPQLIVLRDYAVHGHVLCKYVLCVDVALRHAACVTADTDAVAYACEICRRTYLLSHPAAQLMLNYTTLDAQATQQRLCACVLMNSVASSRARWQALHSWWRPSAHLLCQCNQPRPGNMTRGLFHCYSALPNHILRHLPTYAAMHHM